MHDTAVRVLIGDSLGFHIFFVMIGITLPILISIFEYRARRHHDMALREQVRLWTTAASVFVITGVVSGTLIAVQLALMWPQFMAFVSKVVGPAFMFEGYFFLMEAAFLSWYVASWDTITGFRHWLIGLGTVVGALGSAVVITLVNAWMNQPVGFTLMHGEPTEVNIASALFTSTGFVTVFHSILSYITTVTLAMAGIYALAITRRVLPPAKQRLFRQLALQLSAIGLMAGVLTAVFGDLTAKNLLVVNPQKLAAYELQMKTETGSPLRLGGHYNESTGQVEGAIEIPKLLSILATGDSNGRVQGLDATPRRDWPPLVTHLLFDIKMATAIIALAIPAGLLLLQLHYFRQRWRLLRAIMWRLLPLAGIAAFVTVELGWVMAEVGRQPYIIKGIMLTVNSYLEDASIMTFGYAFPIAFVLLLIATWIALPIALRRTHARQRRKS